MEDENAREQLERLGIKGNSDDSFVIDPKTGKVQEVHWLGNTDTGIVIDRETGKVQEEQWLGNTDTGTVIDPRTGKIQEEHWLGNTDSGFVIDPKTGKLQEEHWLGNTHTGIVIDRKTGKVQEERWLGNIDYHPTASGGRGTPSGYSGQASSGDPSGAGEGLVKFLVIGIALLFAVAVVVAGLPVWLGATATGVVIAYLRSDPNRKYPSFLGLTEERLAGAAGCMFACVESAILFIVDEKSWWLAIALLLVSGLGTFCAFRVSRRVLQWRRTPASFGRWISPATASRLAFGASCLVLGFVILIDLGAIVRTAAKKPIRRNATERAAALNALFAESQRPTRDIGTFETVTVNWNGHVTDVAPLKLTDVNVTYKPYHTGIVWRGPDGRPITQVTAWFGCINAINASPGIPTPGIKAVEWRVHFVFNGANACPNSPFDLFNTRDEQHQKQVVSAILQAHGSWKAKYSHRINELRRPVN